MPIDAFNKVDVETTTGGGTTDIADEAFNGESPSGSSGSFWSPTSGTGWANCTTSSATVISTQNNTNAYWYTQGDTRASGIPANVNVSGWHCTALNTTSGDTGPDGGHAGSGAHDTVGGNEYLYTEMTNSTSRDRICVMRSDGYSLGDSSADSLELSFYVYAHGTAIGNFAVYEAESSTTFGNRSGTNLLAYFRGYSFLKNSATSWRSDDGFTRFKGILNLSSGMQSWSNAFFNEEFGSAYHGLGGLTDWKKVTIPLDGFYGDNATDYPNYLNDTTQTRYFYFVYHNYFDLSEHNAAATEIGSGSDSLITGTGFDGFRNFRGDLAIDDFQITKTTTGSTTVNVDSINKVDADGTPAVSWNGVTLLS